MVINVNTHKSAAPALVDSSDDLIASWLMCRMLLMLMCVFE